MNSRLTIAAGLAGSILLATGSAQAACMTKGANATSGTADSAKWYVMETMVQQVSWGLWPGWVSNGKIAGYSVKSEKYDCKPSGGQVYCRGRATFCTTGS
jgi:hypothetical protein